MGKGRNQRQQPKIAGTGAKDHVTTVGLTVVLPIMAALTLSYLRSQYSQENTEQGYTMNAEQGWWNDALIGGIGWLGPLLSHRDSILNRMPRCYYAYREHGKICVLRNTRWTDERHAMTIPRRLQDLQTPLTGGVCFLADATDQNCLGSFSPVKFYRSSDGSYLNTNSSHICCQEDGMHVPRSNKNVVVVSNSFGRLSNIYHAFAMLYVQIYIISQKYDNLYYIVEPYDQWMTMSQHKNEYISFLNLLAAPLPERERDYRFETLIISNTEEDYFDDWRAFHHDDDSAFFADMKKYVIEKLDLSGIQPQTGLAAVTERPKRKALIEIRPGHREIVNIKDLEEVLVEYGYDIVEVAPSSYRSWKDQLIDLRTSSVVVASHGAFHTMNAFGHDSSTFIEIQPYQFRHTNPVQAICYFNWARKFGFQLAILEGKPYDTDKRDGRERKILAPIDAFREVLRSISG